MEREPVTSSNIRSVGYDPETSTLEVEFNSGTVYQYAGVPQHEYDGLMSGGSVGTYFNAHIKNSFPYTKL